MLNIRLIYLALFFVFFAQCKKNSPKFNTSSESLVLSQVFFEMVIPGRLEIIQKNGSDPSLHIQTGVDKLEEVKNAITKNIKENKFFSDVEVKWSEDSLVLSKNGQKLISYSLKIETYTCAVTNADALNKINASKGDVCILLNDINLENHTWKDPIDNFVADFDGLGYKIINLKNASLFEKLSGNSIQNLVIENGSLVDNTLTVFGFLAKEAEKTTIKNIELKNISIQGQEIIGSLLGKATNVTLSDIRVENFTLKGNSKLGGLIGEIEQSKLSYIQIKELTINEAKVKPNNVGGLLGGSRQNNISHTYVEATIDAQSTIGGIIGDMYKDTLLNVFFTGTMSSSATVDFKLGGLVGSVSTNGANQIKNAYAKFECKSTTAQSCSPLVGASLQTADLAISIYYPTLEGGNWITSPTFGESLSEEKLSADNFKDLFKDWSPNTWKFTKGEWPKLKF